MVRYHNSGTQKFDDVESKSLSTGSVNIEGITPDMRLGGMDGPDGDSDDSFTSTSFTTVFTASGSIPIDDLTAEYDLYGRIIARVKNDTSNESVTIQPRVRDLSDGTISNLSNVRATETATSFTLADSGWQPVQTTLTGPLAPVIFQGEVSGGTGTVENSSAEILFAGVSN